MKRKTTIAFLMALLGVLVSDAQVAVKTNLLYDATTTPNIGAELRVSERSTVNLVYGFNPWSFSSESHGKRYVKHWVLMPEYRWWLCVPYSGHFFGVHAFGGEMNAVNVSLVLPGAFFGGDNIVKGVKDHRYQGTFAGAGATYGYQWMLSRHWNLEAEAGIGYGHVWYDRYTCGECGVKDRSGQSNYVGLTKLGISIMYIF